MAKKKLGLFLGTYFHEVASGGRVTLPSRFKVEITQGQVVMIQAAEGSILCFDTEQFVRNTQKYLSESTLENDARLPRRSIFNNALTVDVDANGRFVIPDNLRKYAGIKEKVVLAGLGDAFEIWDEQKFNSNSAQVKGQL